ncbi:MAG: hypothetical protein ABIT10_09420 [Alteraurantiacibacter sp.]
MKTRLSICQRKARYSSPTEAMAAAQASGLVLRAYRCERCFGYHLTSRTKGRRVPDWERAKWADLR